MDYGWGAKRNAISKISFTVIIEQGVIIYFRMTLGIISGIMIRDCNDWYLY